MSVAKVASMPTAVTGGQPAPDENHRHGDSQHPGSTPRYALKRSKEKKGSEIRQGALAVHDRKYRRAKRTTTSEDGPDDVAALAAAAAVIVATRRERQKEPTRCRRSTASTELLSPSGKRGRERGER